MVNYTLSSTDTFEAWLKNLPSPQTRIIVLARLARLENGNFGDVKALGAGLSELRFFLGAGLRIYFTIRDGSIVVLLVGGDKSTQSRDIAKARKMLADLE